MVSELGWIRVSNCVTIPPLAAHEPITLVSTNTFAPDSKWILRPRLALAKSEDCSQLFTSSVTCRFADNSLSKEPNAMVVCSG